MSIEMSARLLLPYEWYYYLAVTTTAAAAELFSIFIGSNLLKTVTVEFGFSNFNIILKILPRNTVIWVIGRFKRLN